MANKRTEDKIIIGVLLSYKVIDSENVKRLTGILRYNILQFQTKNNKNITFFQISIYKL